MLELQEIVVRMCSDLLDRPSGPLAFRFILQPVMAIGLAVRDGMRDARTGRSPYLQAIANDPLHRRAHVMEGLSAVSRVLLLGVGMDAFYQVSALRTFYPGEALLVALLLAFVPYLLARGPASRVARAVVRIALFCAVFSLSASAF